MRVLTTTYNGDITLFVREHTASDYLFLLINEQTNTYQAYDVTGVYEDSQVTFPVNLSLTADIYYMGFLYPQDGSLVDSSGIVSDWWDNYDALIQSGALSDDINRFKIFATDQTDLNKYFYNQDEYIEPSGNADDKVIII